MAMFALSLCIHHQEVRLAKDALFEGINSHIRPAELIAIGANGPILRFHSVTHTILMMAWLVLYYSE